MRLRPWTISALMVMVAGCGGAEPEGQATEAKPDEQRALRDYAERSLEKARGVEDLSLQRKGELDEELEKAER